MLQRFESTKARARKPSPEGHVPRFVFAAALALVAIFGASAGERAMAQTEDKPAEEKPAETTARVDVTIEGVRDSVRANVRGYLQIAGRHGDALPESEVRALHERAPKQIHTALEPFGFYRPAIQSDLRREGDRWLATYRIDPGPPLRADSVDVRILGPGENDPAFRRALFRLPIKRGEVLEHVRYELSKRRITELALTRGYLDGHYERNALLVDLERYHGTVILHYATGPQYVFGPVEFRQSVMNPDLLQGYTTFRRGEVVNFQKLLDMEDALSSSTYWSRVEVRPRTDLARGNEVPIIVDLTPARREKYTVGAGFGTDNGLHASASAELRRLNRRGHRANVQGTWSTIEWSATGRYHVPWPYPRTDVLTASIGFRELETVTSLERTGLVGLSLARARADWQETFALTYRREHFEVGLDEAFVGFLIPEASWSRVVSDSPLDPRNGRKVLFHVEGAEQNLFSETSYVRADAHAIWIKSFTRRHRGIARAEIGSLWTDRFRSLPPSARFFAGGATSVRGFAYRELGPRDEAGNVIGGEKLAVASLEWEYRIRRTWGGALFWDVGNAFESFSGSLEQGAGIGARWVSPIGLVRLDFGVPLTGDDHGIEVHLAVGPRL